VDFNLIQLGRRWERKDALHRGRKEGIGKRGNWDGRSGQDRPSQRVKNQGPAPKGEPLKGHDGGH